MNRRTVEERMRDELLRARRQGTSISVVMFDVDHFKRINDEYGHQAGDVVLREVAIQLRRSLRRTDLLCRWGGEEFAVVLLDTAMSDAIRQAEHLRTRVGELHVTVPGGQPLTISLSGGVAATTVDTFDLEGLMRTADSRLLRAKRAGRNRIEAAEAAAVA
jgi:diguanylate cyclase (GGDEF)-like protein